MAIADIVHVGPSNLSLAWGKLLSKRLDRGVGDIPATVSITAFEEDGTPTEDADIRFAVDALIQELRSDGKRVNSVDVSGLFVFPYREWIRKGCPSHSEFADYCVNRLGKRLTNTRLGLRDASLQGSRQTNCIMP